MNDCISLFLQNPILHRHEIISKLKEWINETKENDELSNLFIFPLKRSTSIESTHFHNTTDKLSLGERLVKLICWLGKKENEDQFDLLVDLLLFLTANSLEICFLLGESEIPQFLFSRFSKDHINSSPSLCCFLLKILSRIWFVSKKLIPIDIFVLYDLLLDTKDENLQKEIVYSSSLYAFHYRCCKNESIDIVEYKSVTKLLKFVIHSIGESTDPSSSLIWICFMASISLSSSVGIKFFSFSNVEMCLKLLESIFTSAPLKFKLSALLSLFFLFESCRSSSAIRNILKSLQDSLFTLLVGSLVSRESDFCLFLLLMKVCKSIQLCDEFIPLHDHLISSQLFIETLSSWINGFGIECIESCKFLLEEYKDEIPDSIVKLIADLCCDFDFLNHFYTSNECSLSLPPAIFSVAFQLTTATRSVFISQLNLNSLVSFLNDCLRGEVISLQDSILFVFVLNLFQLIPSSTSSHLPSDSIAKICKSPHLSSHLNQVLFECGDGETFIATLKNILFLSQLNPSWSTSFFSQFKGTVEKQLRREHLLLQLVDERKKFLIQLAQKIPGSHSVKTLTESFDLICKRINSYQERVDELEMKVEKQKEINEMQEKQIERHELELKQNTILIEQKSLELESEKDQKTKLETDFSKLKIDLEGRVKELEGKRKELIDRVKQQHELIQQYRIKMTETLADIDEIDQLIGRIEQPDPPST